MKILLNILAPLTWAQYPTTQKNMDAIQEAANVATESVHPRPNVVQMFQDTAQRCMNAMKQVASCGM
jgi:hypothetical protein